MTLLVFAVFDKKIGVYLQPFFQSTRGQAARTFGDNVLEPGSVIGKHPEDYSLYEIGMYEDGAGELVPSRPVHVAAAVDFVERPAQVAAVRKEQ